MTREEALERLSSDSAHDRLKAARFLARNSDPSELQSLREALQSETVSYVRSGLELAIKRALNAASPAAVETIEEFEIPPDVRAQIRNGVTEEITGQILHEIASPVGLIASAAAREIPDFEHSRTKRHVENLKRVFEAIEQLKGAAAVPRPEEFDLAELLADIVSEDVGDHPVEISLHGAKPMLITSDRALVRLAVYNGIRNAVEAVVYSARNEPHPVVVTWGETDVDYWLTVLDCGPGVVGPTESAFGIGKTTKKGHSGFGLAIARQAIETLGGSCTLQPATEGGPIRNTVGAMTLHVLIVEDDDDFVEELREIIAALPGKNNIRIAGSRDEAFDMLGDDFLDLVILDLKIPTVSGALDADPEHGHAVFNRIRSVAHGTPIFVLTGSPAEDFLSGLVLRNQQQIDIWSEGRKTGTIQFLKKYNIDRCPEMLMQVAQAIERLSDVELSAEAFS